MVRIFACGRFFCIVSKMQTIVAKSNLESDHIYQARAVGEALRVRIDDVTMDIHADITDIIGMTKELKDNEATKHIGIDYHLA